MLDIVCYHRLFNIHIWCFES